MSRVFIIGGGPSLRDFKFKKLRGHDCISVNKAIFRVPDPKYFITIDHSFLNKIGEKRAIIKSSKATKFFIANYASGQLADRGGKIFCTKTRKHYELAEFDVVVRSRGYGGLGTQWNDFRNGNCSGYCAFQLATLLGYDEIYLFGLDLTTIGGQTHYHDGYKGQRPESFKKSLSQYFVHFTSGIKDAKNRGIKVVSCSKVSRLNDLIPFVAPSKVL